jgi:type IV secretion system protein VirD4
MSRIAIAFAPLILGTVAPWLVGGVWPALAVVRLPLLIGGGAATLWLGAADSEKRGMTTLLRGLSALGVLAMLVLSVWPAAKFFSGYWASTLGYNWQSRVTVSIHRFIILCARYPDWTVTWGVTAAAAILALILILAALTSRPRAGSGPWQGDFLAPHRVNSLANNLSGIPLGWTSKGFGWGGYRIGRRLLRYVPSANRNWTGGHHLVIAGTRAGKGVGCVIPSILDHQGPVVVLDVKGENLAVCGRARARLGRRQVVLNPFGLYNVFAAKDPEKLLGQPVYGWDPLRYVRVSTIHMQRDIETLVEGLIIPEIVPNDWISTDAKRLLTAFTEYVLTTQKAPTLLTVTEAIMNSNRMAVIESWKGSSLCGGRLDAVAGDFIGMSDKSLSPILSCLSNNLKWTQLEWVV